MKFSTDSSSLQFIILESDTNTFNFHHASSTKASSKWLQVVPSSQLGLLIQITMLQELVLAAFGTQSIHAFVEEVDYICIFSSGCKWLTKKMKQMVGFPFHKSVIQAWKTINNLDIVLDFLRCCVEHRFQDYRKTRI